MISHGNLRVNGRRLDVPSALLDVGASCRPGRARRQGLVRRSFGNERHLPAWLSRDDENLAGRLHSRRASVPLEVNEQLIVGSAR
jgi:small subunit ribosomal protein S4